MSVNKVSEAYYTAAQARNKLGLTEPAFQGWVRDQKVRKIILPGRKQGVYARTEIDLLATSIDMAVLTAKRSDPEFKKATLESLEDEFRLAELTFGEKTAQFHKYRIDLLKRCPDMSYYLYDGQYLVASMNIVPMAHEAIVRFKDGERGWLLGEYVETYTPEKPLECIVIDMMTTPLVPANRRREYAVRLLLGVTNVLTQWGQQGIEIASIHACGGTLDGRRILETAHFKYLGEPRINRHVYELIIAESNLKALEPYKEALATYKQAHR